jgi:hypothetical protein
MSFNANTSMLRIKSIDNSDLGNYKFTLRFTTTNNFTYQNATTELIAFDSCNSLFRDAKLQVNMIEDPYENYAPYTELPSSIVMYVELQELQFIYFDIFDDNP